MPASPGRSSSLSAACLRLMSAMRRADSSKHSLRTIPRLSEQERRHRGLVDFCQMMLASNAFLYLE